MRLASHPGSKNSRQRAAMFTFCKNGYLPKCGTRRKATMSEDFERFAGYLKLSDQMIERASKENQSRMIKIGRATMLVAAGFLLEALSSPDLAEETKIRPGMIIQFKTATPACFSREGLQEYLTYLARREKAKAKAMLFESGGNKCMTLPPTKKLKVISAEYNPGSDIAFLQVVGADVTSAAGSWTFSTGAIPVSQ